MLDPIDIEFARYDAARQADEAFIEFVAGCDLKDLIRPHTAEDLVWALWAGTKNERDIDELIEGNARRMLRRMNEEALAP